MALLPHQIHPRAQPKAPSPQSNAPQWRKVGRLPQIRCPQPTPSPSQTSALPPTTNPMEEEAKKKTRSKRASVQSETRRTKPFRTFLTTCTVQSETTILYRRCQHEYPKHLQIGILHQPYFLDFLRINITRNPTHQHPIKFIQWTISNKDGLNPHNIINVIYKKSRYHIHTLLPSRAQP